MLTEMRATLDSEEKVLARFEGVDTAVYGDSMVNWVPDYELTTQLMLDALRPYLATNAKVVDLGAGTGRASQQLMDEFPDIFVTLTDFSANMLAGAAEKLADYPGRFATVEAGLFDDDFDFADETFDAAISVFAIHHGREVVQYQTLYNKIYNWLKPGSCFLCFDHVLGATNDLTALNMMNWHNMMVERFDMPTRDWIVGTTYQEDSPLPLVQHITYLTEAGFTAVDVLWKKHIFAIYIAIKT